MGKAKRKPESPFVGRWRILSMTGWGQDFVDAEVEGFFEFDAQGAGEFQFGYVRGDIGYQLTERDGQPAIEGTWEGMDEMDPVTGRGWAVLEGDELHGLIFFHQGDNSGFVAKRATRAKRPRREP
jgi:hypothetical protein